MGKESNAEDLAIEIEAGARVPDRIWETRAVGSRVCLVCVCVGGVTVGGESIHDGGQQE